MRNILDRILSIRFLILLVVLILTLILLRSNFSWAEISFGQLLAYPEIRYHYYPSKIARLDRISFSEDIFAVENRGSDSSDEVYIYVMVPAGRITRYDVVSQEPYDFTEISLNKGRMAIQLDRLSPGAKAIFYVWSATEIEEPFPIEFSVTAEKGSVAPSVTLTAEEEVESYLGFLEWTGRQIFHFLQSFGLVEKISS